MNNSSDAMRHKIGEGERQGHWRRERKSYTIWQTPRYLESREQAAGFRFKKGPEREGIQLHRQIHFIIFPKVSSNLWGL